MTQKLFKNKHYTKRDYEATNIVYIEAEENPNTDNWVEVEEMTEPNLTMIGCCGVDGVWARRFGYL